MKTDLKSIDSMINSIAKRGKVLRNDCHSCLIAVVEHHMEHGDYTRLPKLLDAVKNSLGSSLSAAMIDWVHRFYTGLSFDKENGKAELGFFVNVPKVKKEIVSVTAEMKVKFKSSDADAYFIGDAREFPFYELEREVKQQPFDLQAAIIQLVKRAEAAKEANVTKGAHNLVNNAQIEVLRKMAENIKEIKDEDLVPTPQQIGANATESTANKPTEKDAVAKPRRSSKKTETPAAIAA